MNKTCGAIVLAAFVLASCKKTALERPLEGSNSLDGGFSAVASSSVAMTVSSGSPVPSSRPSPPAKPLPEACSQAAYNVGLADGRKAFSEKRYAEAVTDFARAVKARPVDARARGELGYAQLFADKLDDADDNLRVGAELAAGDPKLAAQIWFNRGLVAEKRSQREIARASFAVSDQLNSTSATRAKLVGQSKCPVAVEKATPGDIDPLNIVSGWKNVHAYLMGKIMGGEEGEKEKDRPPPTTEAEAKRRSCVSYALSEKLKGDPCAGDGDNVFEIQTGHLMFRDFVTAVIPLDGGRFGLVDTIRGSGGQAGGMNDAAVKSQGKRLLVITTTGESHFVTREDSCITDALDPDLLNAGGIGFGDVPSLTSNNFVVYDSSTGNALFTGVTWGDSAAANLELSATELKVKDTAATKSCAGAATKL